jgi:phosphoglycerate dehydrogenase-like enzyme
MGMTILSTRGSSSRADLEVLLREADVISMHCPLNEKTRGLIGREELRLMRPGVILVNYSRADVLDEEVSRFHVYCVCNDLKY